MSPSFSYRLHLSAGRAKISARRKGGAAYAESHLGAETPLFGKSCVDLIAHSSEAVRKGEPF